MRQSLKNTKERTSFCRAIIQPIKPPTLNQKDYVRLKNTPIYKRIGLTKKEYNNAEIIKEHEKDFVKRFTQLGFKITWISRIKKKKSGGYFPTNDFIWNNIEWELKRPLKKKYKPIYNRIRDARTSGKMNFIIDLGEATLTQKLAESLAEYNLRKTKAQSKIRRLLVMDKQGLVKIILKRK